LRHRNRQKNLTGPGFRVKESFYKYACSLVFSNAKTFLRDAIVVIDGSGTREFRRELQSYFRRKLGGTAAAPGAIGKLKIQDSRSNNLLQLADMVSGAVARKFSRKADALDYYTLIAGRERHLQVWPRTKKESGPIL
jgi:hypothetical protein